ncbi:hypothetical protein ABKN59_005941 [Abortiporus biennis]
MLLLPTDASQCRLILHDFIATVHPNLISKKLRPNYSLGLVLLSAQSTVMRTVVTSTSSDTPQTNASFRHYITIRRKTNILRVYLPAAPGRCTTWMTTAVLEAAESVVYKQFPFTTDSQMSSEDQINFPVVQKNLSGKIIAVIGANTGIGLEAAKHFARMNPAKLILGCRTYEKGKNTASLIEKETGFTNAESWPIELEDFSTVRAFAERFEKEDVLLDILINNAAVGLNKYTKTVDGWETSVQVNHLSLALLTILLLPRLLETAKSHSHVSRIVSVSSKTHFWTTFKEERMPFNQVIHTLSSSDTPMEHRYPDTKLLSLLFERAFNQHLPSNAPLIIDAPCPGLCISDLRRHIDETPYAEALKLARTAEEGSRQLIYAALAPTTQDESKGIHLDDFRGAFLSQTSIAEPSEWVLTEEAKKVQEGLWEETIAILAEVDPKVTSIVQKFLHN